MNKYLGFRRPQRLDEMARTFNAYGSPLVDPTPMPLDNILELVDESSQDEGGQGSFFLLKGSKGRFGVKIFDPRKTTPEARQLHAKHVSHALLQLSTTPPASITAFLLFNYLNIPQQYVIAPDGGLAGLLVPTVPDSCYIQNVAMGMKSYRCGVRLGDVVSTRSAIPQRSGRTGDPLPDCAKWSILDSLCQTIASLHHIGLIHADISSNNVYVRWPESSDPKAYTIDAFNGFSALSNNEHLGHMRSDVFCPTSLYRQQYTPATDTYCLAWWISHIAVVANPIASELPVPGYDDIKLRSDTLYIRHRYVSEGLNNARSSLPRTLYDMLTSAISEDPYGRPSARELCYLVHDHWMNFGDER